jgi:hypothetical protein
MQGDSKKDVKEKPLSSFTYYTKGLPERLKNNENFLKFPGLVFIIRKLNVNRNV